MTVLFPITVLFFLSGAAGLIYELLWLKSFSLLFGNTTHAAAAVLAAFFGGSALGNRILGRRADRVRHPLAMYALLETLIPLAALGTQLLLGLYHSLVALFPEAVVLSDAPGWGPKLLLAGIGLFLPTFLMGGTLPAVARAIAGTDTDLSRRTSVIYAVHTLGAVTGVFAGGFLLPPAVGHHAMFWIAVILNFTAALGSFLICRRFAVPVTSEPVVVAPAEPSPLSASWVRGLAFWSGAALLGLEVLWTRMFSLVLQNSVYTFSTILLTVLVGLALGAFAVRMSGKRGTRILLTSLVVTGSCLVATPFLFYHLTNHLDLFARGAGWPGYLFWVLGLTAAVILVPTTFGGMLLPLLWRWSAPDRGAGERVGTPVAWNTLGAIAGSLAAGFIMIPKLGMWNSVSGIGLVYLALSLACSWKCLPVMRWRAVTTCGSLLVIAAGAAALHRLPVTCDHDHEKVVFVREDGGGMVSIAEEDRHHTLRVDNFYTLGSTWARMEEARQGHLPLLLHPAPKHVAFIGVATGITVGAAVPHPVERITAVEILPGVVEALPYFSPHHHDFARDRRTRIIVGDGRTVLTLSPDRYDVIVSDLFIPWHAGTGSLYTVDFYRAMERKLHPDGLFCQWLPLYQLSETEFHVMAAGFADVFPHVTLWKGGLWSGHPREHPLVALIGSQQPLRVSADRLESRLSDLRRHTAIQDPFLTSASYFLLLYAGNGNTLKEEYRRMPRNTDNTPWIEFSAPISHRREKTFTGADLIAFSERLIRHLPAESKAAFQGWPVPVDHFMKVSRLLPQARKAVADGKDEERFRLIREIKTLAPGFDTLPFLKD